jgi:excisionase family DNA binding protein
MENTISTAKNLEGKRLLTVKAAALYMSVSPITLYHWVSRREIPFVKLAHKAVRFDIRQLDRWIDKHAHKTADQAREEGRQAAARYLMNDIGHAKTAAAPLSK